MPIREILPLIRVYDRQNEKAKKQNEIPGNSDFVRHAHKPKADDSKIQTISFLNVIFSDTSNL